MIPLKEATSEKHRLAEQQPFNQRMFRGALSEADYLLYLEQQAAIFITMEKEPLPHPDLNRSEKVMADLAELQTKGHALKGVLSATQNYTQYLETCSEEHRLAHVYLNYLAVMFGGQMMKNVVPSSGKMYEFENMPEALQAIRQVQKNEWAEEVNRGFDFHIAMFQELETATQTQDASSL